MPDKPPESPTDPPGPKDARIPEAEALDIWGPIVKVIVGDSDQIFYFHQGLLSSSSSFFRAAMKPEWDERRAETNTIDLRDTDPAIFRLYAHWAYFGTIPMPTEANASDTFVQLAHAYVLGEKLMSTKFKNTILDTFITSSMKFGFYPIGEPVAVMYEGTAENSAGRRLLVEFCAYVAHGKEDSWMLEFENCPKEFLVDVMKVMVKVRPAPTENPWPWLEESTQYHEKDSV
ncbi:uncharacterized protein BDR25DRAFT_268063 [Lindgomyces ingoldianus]|uniref:Uncharacterized protein n=1 Tax=Lindgomyces ingoldianus TaxID=673940 RepID=A0ACB6QIB0_9PLEO|nr:uncharacterized protein BDR25DRAFT_268063 [Lindgomyces ingoldianus]KAF2466689.1 hypothetical protein BDR25DRAFT_268063 [Lindgomyces ingoldianus]